MKAEGTAGSASIKRDQTLLFIVILTIAIGNTGLQSVLPAIGRILKLPDTLIGLAFSFSALAWSLAAPFWGRRLGTMRAKTMVLVGLGGYCASLFVCAIALTSGLLGWVAAGLSFAGFVIGRGLYGSFGSAAPPASQALVALTSSRGNRTNALTMLASAFGLGTVLGPALAPFFLLPILGLAGPPVIFCLMGLVVMVIAATQLSDHGVGEVREAQAEQGLPRRLTRYTDPRIWPWMLFGIVSGNTQAMVGQSIAFLLIDRLKVTPQAAQPLIGIVLMAGAGASLLAQWGVVGRLRMTPFRMVLWGAGFAALGSAAITLAHDLHMLAMAFALASLGFGFLRPGFTAGASLAVEDEEQGIVAGHVTATNGSAFLFGPSIGITMYQIWRPLPYLTAAVLLLCILAYGWRRLGGRAPAMDQDISAVPAAADPCSDG
ncbi:MFS transporter [Sphingobium sp. Sx8-8]|uniref:MFS transporter n=1 Tax=Sphingobium sp. Sx8-8 TaxID=2933617 RepID=UPI001F581F65|nr:MFS transporter [Sphingobium sp. Sx8-8]